MKHNTPTACAHMCTLTLFLSLQCTHFVHATKQLTLQKSCTLHRGEWGERRGGVTALSQLAVCDELSRKKSAWQQWEGWLGQDNNYNTKRKNAFNEQDIGELLPTQHWCAPLMAFDNKGCASEDLQWLTRGDKELEAVLSEKLAHFLNIYILYLLNSVSCAVFTCKYRLFLSIFSQILV